MLEKSQHPSTVSTHCRLTVGKKGSDGSRHLQFALCKLIRSWLERSVLTVSPCCLQRGIVGIPASPLPLASCRLVIRALCAIWSSEPCWVPCARVGHQLGTPALSGARVVQSQMEELWLLTDLPSCAVLPMGCGGGGRCWQGFSCSSGNGGWCTLVFVPSPFFLPPLQPLQLLPPLPYAGCCHLQCHFPRSRAAVRYEPPWLCLLCPWDGTAQAFSTGFQPTHSDFLLSSSPVQHAGPP